MLATCVASTGCQTLYEGMFPSHSSPINISMLFYHVYFSFLEQNLNNSIENLKKKYLKGVSKILALLRASLVKVEYIKEKGRQTLILFICFNHVRKRQFQSMSQAIAGKQLWKILLQQRHQASFLIHLKLIIMTCLTSCEKN